MNNIKVTFQPENEELWIPTELIHEFNFIKDQVELYGEAKISSDHCTVADLEKLISLCDVQTKIEFQTEKGYNQLRWAAEYLDSSNLADKIQNLCMKKVQNLNLIQMAAFYEKPYNDAEVKKHHLELEKLLLNREFQ